MAAMMLAALLALARARPELVDRLEGDRAVLVSEAGVRVVPRKRLSPLAREGTMVRGSKVDAKATRAARARVRREQARIPWREW
jgi:hypothetical protein